MVASAYALSMGASVAQASQHPYRELICSYDWPCEKAMRVMMCESTGDARAYNQSNYGLFQINAIHRARVGGDLQSLYIPDVNVAIAHAIWSEQGWNPWGCRGA